VAFTVTLAPCKYSGIVITAIKSIAAKVQAGLLF